MDVPASSVYTAGPHHALFSLSLTDAYRADYGFQTDFARVEGLPGVYIANQVGFGGTRQAIRNVVQAARPFTVHRAPQAESAALFKA